MKYVLSPGLVATEAVVQYLKLRDGAYLGKWADGSVYVYYNTEKDGLISFKLGEAQAIAVDEHYVHYFKDSGYGRLQLDALHQAVDTTNSEAIFSKAADGGLSTEAGFNSVAFNQDVSGVQGVDAAGEYYVVREEGEEGEGVGPVRIKATDGTASSEPFLCQNVGRMDTREDTVQVICTDGTGSATSNHWRPGHPVETHPHIVPAGSVAIYPDIGHHTDFFKENLMED